jgi:hypothetical protein
MQSDLSLTDRLAAVGIRHEPLDGFRRKLYRGDKFLGSYSYEEALAFTRPAEDLTPEGIQLVIPGAERIQPASVKQGDLF